MDSSPAPSRKPPGPRLAVLAVVLRGVGAGAEVLLVRRANPPQAGHWGFPGGKVEWGEDLGAAARRELREETGITAHSPRAFAAIDLVGAADHHLMVALRLTWCDGEPRAGDDALEARWAPAGNLPEPLCADVDRVVARALHEPL